MNKVVNYIKNKPIFFILFLTLISSIPLFLNNNLVSFDDFLYHFERIRLIKEELDMGNIFSKMYHNYLNGFGYGSGLFYPDIFLYIPAFFLKFGLSEILSYKLFVILINLFSILSIYYCIKNMIKKEEIAKIGSIIYAISSYRLVDIYIRCALGEALSFIFLPLVIYGIYLLIYDDYKKIYVLILGMSGLIYSHLLSSFITILLLFIIVLINYKRFLKEKKRIIYLLLSTIITLAITSYYVFPMLEQLIDRNFYIYSVDSLGTLSDRAVPFYKSILAIPYNNSNYWIPLGIGVIYIYIIYLYFKEYKTEKNKINLFDFDKILFILGIILLFMSTNLFPWFIFNNISLSIQFPWRLYAFVSLFLIISGSILLYKKYHKNIYLKKYLLLLNVIPLLYCSVQYLLFNHNDINKFQATSFIGLGDYLPKEININNLNIILNNDYNLNIDKKEDYMIINYNKENDNIDIIEVPYIYYLGYKAKYNNKELKVIKTNNGLVGINVKNVNKGKIKVYYDNTKLTDIFLLVSLLGILFTIIYIIKNKSNQIIEKNKKN